MNYVTVKHLVFGKGRPKICVPIVGCTKEKILEEAETILSLPADLAEWRADWYEDGSDPEKVLDILRKLQKILSGLPLLFTFRTSSEGGRQDINPSEYTDLCRIVSESGLADLIDIEVLKEGINLKNMIHTAHMHQVRVIGSSHDFDKTPEKEELIRRLQHMQEMDVDLPKIAVMPHSEEDVKTLLDATFEMSHFYADRPVITMSMSETGVISRLAGEFFGSCLTFGAASKTSAPGQVNVSELKDILEKIHSFSSQNASEEKHLFSETEAEKNDSRNQFRNRQPE